MPYRYKMVQIPRDISLIRGLMESPTGQEAAVYLQSVVTELAGQGWEFYRVDAIGIETRPGCVASLFGGKTQYEQYYVITFRIEAA